MSDSCISGGLLYLDSDARSQRWKLGAAGSIVLNSPICSQYKLANLAISAIKDDDIENMLDTTVYVSIVNPASGMVRIEALIMRNIDLLRSVTETFFYVHRPFRQTLVKRMQQ
jgi:hypothetical protein